MTLPPNCRMPRLSGMTTTGGVGEVHEHGGEVPGPLGTASPWCNVCGRDSIPGSYLCPECWRLMHRVESRRDADGNPRHPDRLARLDALRRNGSA